MTQKRREAYDDAPTAIGELCKTAARRQFLKYILKEIDSGHTEPRKTGAFIENTAASRNAFRDHYQVFVEYDLMHTVEKEDKYTLYGLNGDSPIAEILLDIDDILWKTAERTERTAVGASVIDLYNGDSRRALVDFFIYLEVSWRQKQNDDQFDDEEIREPLNKSDIRDMTGMTRKSIIKELPILVEYEIVEKHTDKGYDHFSPDTKSTTLNYLIDANEAINHHLEEKYRTEA